MININEGRNGVIAQRCRKLAEYSAFIAKVRAFEQELKDKENAMKAAIKYCREHDILKEFLEQHTTEVFNMLITEWNTADAIAVNREEGREEGQEAATTNIARNALAKGATPEFVQDITGLDMDVIRQLTAD